MIGVGMFKRIDYKIEDDLRAYLHKSIKKEKNAPTDRHNCSWYREIVFTNVLEWLDMRKDKFEKKLNRIVRELGKEFPYCYIDTEGAPDSISMITVKIYGVNNNNFENLYNKLSAIEEVVFPERDYSLLLSAYTVEETKEYYPEILKNLEEIWEKNDKRS